MSIELDAEGQKIRNELAGAKTNLATTETALEEVTGELDGLEKRETDLAATYKDELESLEQARTSAILGQFDPRIKSIMAFALGNDAQKLPDNPDVEACQRIAELDAKLKAFAGQPVVVINPGKGWIDIGTLPQTDPEARIEPKGLILASPTRRKSRIEIGVYNVFAINPDTGDLPDSDLDVDGELFARDNGFAEMHRPIVDPAATRAVLPNETAEDYSRQDNEATLVLIGHTHLRNVLNDILGFEVDGDPTEAGRHFHSINMIVKEMRQKGTRFDDPDLIDGYLLHRIAQFEQEIEEDGLPPEQDAYRRQALESLWDKYAALVEHGWIKAK